MLEECRCKWWSDSLQVYTKKNFFFFPVEESYAEFAIKVVHFFFFTMKVVVINPHTIQKENCNRGKPKLIHHL